MVAMMPLVRAVDVVFESRIDSGSEAVDLQLRGRPVSIRAFCWAGTSDAETRASCGPMPTWAQLL